MWLHSIHFKIVFLEIPLSANYIGWFSLGGSHATIFISQCGPNSYLRDHVGLKGQYAVMKPFKFICKYHIAGNFRKVKFSKTSQ